jgi:tRNA pseudouridine38-40 synthase
MARFRLGIEYAGTRYAGWQIQKNARTVAGELRRAVLSVTKVREVEIYGSGRTDAGVHALEQVAHLDVVSRLSPETLRRAVNDELPADIHVLTFERASSRFHARHDAVARSYLYQISRRRTAFGKTFVWWIKDELQAAAIRHAAQLFVGMHDFRSFTDQRSKEGSTRVLVEEVTVAEEGDLLLIRVLGSHFLWKMVRRMVGVLAEVGRGRLRVQDVGRFLEKASEFPARHTAPPSGLFLERVFFAGDPRSFPLVSVLRIGSPGTKGPSPPREAGRRRGRAVTRA